jgi:hypothetical protein
MTSDSQLRGPATGLLPTKVVDVRATALSRLVARAAAADRRPTEAGAGADPARVPVAAFDASL